MWAMPSQYKDNSNITVILWTLNIYKYTLCKTLCYLVLDSDINKKECSYAYHKI